MGRRYHHLNHAKIGYRRSLFVANIMDFNSEPRRIYPWLDLIEFGTHIASDLITLYIVDLVSVLLNSRVVLGSRLAKPARARLPRPKLCIYGGSGGIFSLHYAIRFRAETVTLRAMEWKQKSELPPGAGYAPKQ